MSIFILENISKSFQVDKNEIQVLKNINLTFPNKGLFSIVGKSGSGKSTLLNIMMGIEKPTSGKILFKGKNLRKVSDRKFSNYHLSEISLVFQHYNLFDDLSVLDNVTIPARMSGIKRRKYLPLAKELLKKFHIENLEKRKAGSLSGGEKQRVSIARALINKPSVILCDEPTGALDSKNSQEIMGILKEMSANLLVIMVSHNQELVKKFSDGIIEIKDGTITSKENIPVDLKENKTRKRIRYSSWWVTKFLFKNLKNNFIKNLFCIISCCIGFASMFLCVGFVFGSKVSQEEALMKNLTIGCATVSSTETVVLKDSPLTFQKTIRPTLEEIDSVIGDFNSLSVEENLSYFISSACSCSFNGESLSNFIMSPVYDLTLENYGSDLLIKGSTGQNNFDEILVNEEFINLYDNIKVNDEILFRNLSNVSYDTFDQENPFIKDQLIIEKPMKIVGIIKEFPFLNSPKIYYSYQGAKEFLKSNMMENLSYYKGTFISFYDYLVDAKNDDEITSYSSFIFLKDLTECKTFFEVVENSKNNAVEITSSALEIKSAYEMFISSFSKTLLVFVVIAFVGINLILGMISLSTYIDNKKNTAVLTCLGSRNSSIYKIYLFENYLLIGISFLLSLFLSCYLESSLNPIISKRFALDNLIAIPFDIFLNIKYGLIILLVLTSVFFSTIFSIIPMSIYRNGFISDELRDE